MGDGFTDITEDLSPNIQTQQYVNMKNSSSSVNGYDFSCSPERDCLSDSLQTAIDTAFKIFPTGTDAKTYYYRYFKSDLTLSSGTLSGECIKIPVIVVPSSDGGAAGEQKKATKELRGAGDAEKCTCSITSSGVFTITAPSS